ncbi:hypothetical protein A9Q79_05550 [Methylophaga sp. 42_25_T18]|nr:hypothetical protein A9Q79_05550 [Methylophaga sp. 42_25_T18]OUR88357.1 hypothetical protein A9Q92_02940 [Methylophaga sp. 42_8_T64]
MSLVKIYLRKNVRTKAWQNANDDTVLVHHLPGKNTYVIDNVWFLIIFFIFIKNLNFTWTALNTKH